MCSRLDSLQKKRHKLQSDRNSVSCVTRPADSQPTAEGGAVFQHRSKPVIGNSCAVLSLSSSALLPPPEFKSGTAFSQLGDVLPLPVQTLNRQMRDSSLLQYRAADVAGPVTASSTSSQLGSAQSPLMSIETAGITAGQIQAASSVKSSTRKLPTLHIASQNSVIFNPSQQTSVLAPANGLVVSVAADSPANKTSAIQTQRLLVPQTVSAFNKAVIIAPGTSVTGNSVWSSGSQSGGVGTGQFIQLTIPPTVLNLTGTNIQIRQYVSVPPVTGRSVLVGSQTTLNVACSTPTEICTGTDAGTVLQQSAAASFQEFHTANTSVSRNKLVGRGLVNCDPLSAQPMCTDSVCSRSDSVAEVPASCSTPPANHDENCQFDPAADCDEMQAAVLLRGSVIPNIPTPDPSCSSQE